MRTIVIIFIAISFKGFCEPKKVKSLYFDNCWFSQTEYEVSWVNFSQQWSFKSFIKQGQEKGRSWLYCTHKTTYLITLDNENGPCRWFELGPQGKSHLYDLLPYYRSSHICLGVHPNKLIISYTGSDFEAFLETVGLEKEIKSFSMLGPDVYLINTFDGVDIKYVYSIFTHPSNSELIPFVEYSFPQVMDGEFLEIKREN